MKKRYPRYILGIHNSGPISSSAILRDGKLLAAAAEERFSRIKHDRSFPHKAMEFCLKYSGIDLADVGNVAIGWNPGENVSLKYRSGFSDWMRYPGEWLTSVPNHILPYLNLRVRETRSIFEGASGDIFDIRFIDHHICHARLAYETSGYDECAILVADGWSEQKVTTWLYAKNGKFEIIKSKEFPHSIGCLYAAMTDFLGYKPFNDEWKIMGMSAYGNAKKFPQIYKLVKFLDSGDYELNLSYFDFYNFDKPRFFSQKMELLLGPSRNSKDALLQRHYDIAKATQLLFEKLMDHVLNGLQAMTGSNSLAMSGGCAMNCLYNGKIVEKTNFSKSHISFAPDDSGNAIGAAMEIASKLGIQIKAERCSSSLGAEFSDDEIAEVLEKYKLRHRFIKNIAREVAYILSNNMIVGWFQGRSEFGQRALGHRSILASPQRSDMKDRINSSIKYRESYRPFAPMIQEEKMRYIFETNDSGPVPYMEKAFRFKGEVVKFIPAVVHEDGTGRLQTVSEDSEPLAYKLLAEFEDITGCPVLLNTSFNLNGEPIVNTAEDAIRTFVTSGLDALVIGSYLLEKGNM